jgi:nicotinamide-nucleotide amidase
VTTAARVVDGLRRRRWVLVTAESCTGGLVAAAITDVAGSSEVFDCGYVTYSNVAKTDMLGVASDLIVNHGAVSAEVARAMVEGAVKQSGAQIAVAITGIAGPGGGSAAKPVGLVHFATFANGEARTDMMNFGDIGRDAVRQRATAKALQLVLERL